ncbi:MAG: YncE family protein [Candidatus Sungiibacteriota bacterium]
MFKYSSFRHNNPLVLSALVGLAVVFSIVFTAKSQDNKLGTSPINAVVVPEKSNEVFILNNDRSLSVYDVEKRTFGVFNASFSSAVDKIVVSPTGKSLAVIGTYANNISVSVYLASDLISAQESSPAAGVYALARTGRGSLVVGMFSSDEKKLYIADTLGKKIYSIELEKRGLSEINTPAQIVNLYPDPAGENLYILTQNPDEVLIWDIQRSQIVRRHKVGPMPAQMLYQENLKRLYISNRGDDSVSVINIISGNVNKVRVGRLPVSLADDNTTNNVFVASNGDGVISTISPDLSIQKVELGLPAYTSYPIYLWYSESAKKLMALNSYGRVFYIVDPASQKIVHEETVKGWARYITGNSDSNYGIVHRANSYDISIFDVRTGEISYVPYADQGAESIVFSSPQSVTMDEELGKIYVSNLGFGSITVIDSNSLKAVARITTGSDPQVMALNKKTKKLYVTHPADNMVIAVDTLRGDYPTKMISVDGAPFSMAINEKTNTIYVTSPASKSVAVIDGTADSLATTIDLGPRGDFPLLVSVNEEKNKVYVANYGGNSVMAINGETNKVEKTITVGAKPIWVKYIHELDQVYVAVEGDKKIIVINPNTYEITKTFQIQSSPYRILFDETAELVYVVHRNDKNVTILKKQGDGAEIVSEDVLPFFGQLDTTYNMLWKDRKANRFYFTSQPLNSLTVLDIKRNQEGIMQLAIVAIVSANGQVSKFDTATGRLIETIPVEPAEKPGEGLPYRWVLIGMLVLLAAIGGFIWMKRSGSASALPPHV